MVTVVAEVKGPPVDRPVVPEALAAWVRPGTVPGVAPGPLELLRSLLNTDDRFHDHDGLAEGPPALVEVRDALRAHLVGAGREHAGEGPGGSAGEPAARLAAVAARHPLVVAVGASGGTELVPAPGLAGEPAAVAVLLALLHRTTADGSWDRLKECANPACRWVFYDSSRNRSGRWCAMGECGDVMKARAYRGRRRAD